MMINCLQTRTFKQKIKKLPSGAKSFVDQQIKLILDNPELGEKKVGDLKDVLVTKFKIHTQLYLLAYSYDLTTNTITLLALDSHENFYRDLKRNLSSTKGKST